LWVVGIMERRSELGIGIREGEVAGGERWRWVEKGGSKR